MSPTTRPRPSGPSRSRSSGPTRTRSGTRRSTLANRSEEPADIGEQPTAAPAVGAWFTLPGGVGITPRAIALLAVLAILAISFGNSIRIYISQESEIASLRAETQQRQQRIDELNGDLARWQDQDYVRAQARERLGWVVPGETGFRVIGPDGEAVGASIDSAPRSNGSGGAEAPWWGKASGSIDAADHPVPQPTAEPDPAREPPIRTDEGE